MEGGAKNFPEAMSADPESVPLLSGQQVAEQCTGGGTADWAIPTGNAGYGGLESVENSLHSLPGQGSPSPPLSSEQAPEECTEPDKSGKVSSSHQVQDKTPPDTVPVWAHTQSKPTKIEWILRTTKDHFTCSRRMVGYMLSIVGVAFVLLAVVASFMIAAIAVYYTSDTERIVSLQQGDTVLLDQRGGFRYETLTFTVIDSSEDEYELFVYHEPCDELKVHTQKDVFNSPTLSGITDPFALLHDLYLVSDSHLSLNLTSNSSDRTLQGKVCIFDKKDRFQQFLDGDGLDHYVKCFDISLGVGNNRSNSAITYTFTETSYYYVGFAAIGSGLQSFDPVDVQYNFTLLANSYNYSDYTHEPCLSVASNDGCTVSLKQDWTNSGEKLCILGFTPVPPIVELRYVDVKEHMQRRFFNILVLVFVLLVGLVVLVTVTTCV